MPKILLKKYVNNLKWIWIPFLLFALSLTISFLTAYIGIRFSIPNSNENSNSQIALSFINDFFTQKINSLKFNENLPIAMNNMFSISWLKNTLLELNEFVQSSTFGNQEIQNYTEIYKNNIVLYTKIALIITICGIFLTNFFSQFFIYKVNIKKKLSQTILSFLINTFVVSTILSLSLTLTTAYRFSAFISFAILLVITTTLYLIKSFFIFGKGKVKITNIINVKNILLAILGEIILYCFALIVVLPIYFTLGVFISLLI